MYNVTDNGELLLSLGTGNKYIITEGEWNNLFHNYTYLWHLYPAKQLKYVELCSSYIDNSGIVQWLQRTQSEGSKLKNPGKIYQQ